MTDTRGTLVLGSTVIHTNNLFNAREAYERVSGIRPGTNSGTVVLGHGGAVEWAKLARSSGQRIVELPEYGQ